jgi:uncharacterized protein YndB with AHSA1/START domain
MPSFDQYARSEAPPEQVWKLLYDPRRFPEWWVGIETVEPEPGNGDDTARYTMYPEGYPDFPMPQQLRSSAKDRSVRISCLISDLRFDWVLQPLDGGEATAISVHVEIPEQEEHRLATQREVIRRSLARLAELAATETDEW